MFALGRFVLFAALIAVTRAVSAQTAASDNSILASARPTIAAANAGWLGAMKREDAATIVAPYADSALFILPNGDVYRGRAAIEQLMRDRFARGKVVGGWLKQDGLTVQGASIYEWGHAETEVVRDGKMSRVTGRYLTVWSRGPDGRWHIARNLTFP